jgi:hypothetical protein
LSTQPRLFFSGYENSFAYERSTDLSFGQSKLLTGVAVTFEIEAEDRQVRQELSQILELLNIGSSGLEEVTIYLTFSSSSNPSYRVFPNSKRPKDASAKSAYSRLERQFVSNVLSMFSVHYIPSDKSTEQLYKSLVRPFLLQEAYGAVTPHLSLISGALDGVAESLDGSLKSAGLPNVSCSFEFSDNPAEFFKDVSFTLKDPSETSIFNKGMGIQSAALLAAFSWITKMEVQAGKSVLWLLEEPESYLHPELASQCDLLINELRRQSQVVCTTHSLAFVPQDPKLTVGVGLEDGWTAITTFKTYVEATRKIRDALGVRFSDFYNLDHFNVAVEGETDRYYLQALIDLLTRLGLSDRFPILTSGDVSFLDHGGVNGLVGFLKATYEFIRRERTLVAVFDGDEAGTRGRRELAGYFGKKEIPFQSNQHFLIVRDRFAIEGLFPDEWVQALYKDSPNWFDDCEFDAAGTLLPFCIKDRNKKQFQDAMFRRLEDVTDEGELERWFVFLEALESALSKETSRLSKLAS